MQKLIARITETPFGYRYLRGLIYFGVRLRPLRRALALQAGDRILDVGCGTGDYAPLVDRADCEYVGLDLSEPYIAKARKRQTTPFRRFEVGDIRTMAFAPGSFTKALLIGVMHHLTDDENLGLLHALNRVITDRLVIMDLSPGGWHWVNNVLCSLDRGRYPRSLAEQRKLIEQAMDVSSVDQYFVRSGIQKHSLIVARPRR